MNQAKPIILPSLLFTALLALGLPTPTFGEWVDPETPEGVLPDSGQTGWALVFSDEFNGSLLDTSKWGIDISTSTRAPRTDRGISDWWWVEDNVSLDGSGNLVLDVTKHDSDTMYCGSISSDGLYEPKYGYLEARIQIADSTKDTHTAFWLQGANMGNVDGTGNDGAEVDIFESAWFGDYTKAVVHIDGYGANHQANTKQYDTPGLHSGYHTFGLEWMPNSMKIYYDGVHKVTYTGIWVPQVAEWLWLSTGASFGDIGNFSSEPVGWLTSAKVDYVRVWEYIATPAAGPITLVGGSLLNGDFNANPGESVTFSQTEHWYNTKGQQSQVATKANNDYDGSQNGTLTGGRGFGVDTGHSIVEGDRFDFSYVWKDDWNWVDGSDQATVSLFVTDDNTLTGTRTDLVVDYSGLRQVNDAYEAISRENAYTAVAADAGKTLFAAIETTSGGFARIDNFVLSVNPPFKTWIASYGLDPEQQGLDDDPDGDGIPNGFEAWFGTHPGEISAGITAISEDGLTFSFSHPLNENPPADLSASYLWSPNLVDWYAGDGADGPAGGASVLFETTITDQTAQVTATASTPMDQMFSRIALTTQ